MCRVAQGCGVKPRLQDGRDGRDSALNGCVNGVCEWGVRIDARLQDARDGRDSVLQKREAEVLPDRPDELLARAEPRARADDDRVEELQGEQLRSQLDRVLCERPSKGRVRREAQAV